MNHVGLDALLYEILRVLPTLPQPAGYAADGLSSLESIAPATGFSIERENGAFFAIGPGMRRLVDSVNFSDQESISWFHRSLQKLGVIEALRNAGAKQGDTVFVEEQEFDFVD
jgi:GTP-binding protein